MGVLVLVPASARAQQPSAAAYSETGANVLPAPGFRSASTGSADGPRPAAPASGQPRRRETGSRAEAPAAVGRRDIATTGKKPAALPFTGADLLIGALAGAALMIVGLMLRHTTRRIR